MFSGALGVAFYLFGSSFLLINSHLTPHENKLNDRIRDYHTIVKNLNFPKTLGSPTPAGNSLKPTNSLNPDDNNRGNKTENIFDKFDYVFWMGDLNFRLKLTYEEIKKSVKKIMSTSLFSPSNSANLEDQNGFQFSDDSSAIAEESLSYLLSHDQLTLSKDEKACFADLWEQEISFLPTYKFDLFTDTYDSSGKKRCPAFTDRILFSGRRHDSIKSLFYESCMAVSTSDHKPVLAVFETPIEPVDEDVRDKIVLGGGNFDHDVYSRALNRNREKSRLRASRHSINSIAPVSSGTPHLNAIAASRNTSSAGTAASSNGTSNVCSIQ